MNFIFNFIFIIITLLLICNISYSKKVEEFIIHGPMDLHNVATESFVETRRLNPEATMESDDEFMMNAKKHAVRRGVMTSEEDLLLRKENSLEIGMNEDTILRLPSPEGHVGQLIEAANKQSFQVSLNDAGSHKAMALEFSENIGMGAISRSGAMSMGGDGSWIKFAEDKLKRDAQLDYNSLMWEAGTEIIEKATIERGGMNKTYEDILFKNMTDWLVNGGGKINYVNPDISEDDGFRLIATEDVQIDDAIVTVPMKLIMCQQTARNVLIKKKGKYLGEELDATFKKNEYWGMTIFLLHEYYKEMNGGGSKWGPFLRTLRMRFLTTEVINSIKGTLSSSLLKQWVMSSNKFLWWSTGSEGPCTPITGICSTHPKDKNSGQHRFNLHQIRWAYWIVKQNSVKIVHKGTGHEFVALVPFLNFVDKKVGGGGGVTLDLDGMISVRAGANQAEGSNIGLHIANFTDAQFFLRYFRTPSNYNPNNFIKFSIPGAIPQGSKFHYCMKGTAKQMRSDNCMGSYKSESLFWKVKVLGEWRKQMNLPPRLQDLRMWATRLHLYGSGDEIDRLSNTNRNIAGLPISTDMMSAEEQLMLLGVVDTVEDAQLMVTGTGEKAAPQLYAAPDPEEDPEAQKSMENLAMLAVQVQNVIASGNVLLNATQQILNQTNDFFMHGVLPKSGLDVLDEFLLKKIGMISHCGFEQDMKIVDHNISEELMCAMRVHLMNESEIYVFCPADVRAWDDNCHNVEFMNFTAISEHNELNVVEALRNSLHGLLSLYPTTIEEDQALLDNYNNDFGQIMQASIEMRLREKLLLSSALDFINEHEIQVKNGTLPFQIDLKRKERIEADRAEEEHLKYIEEIRRKAAIRSPVATVEVDMGKEQPKLNLTIEEGYDIKDVVKNFCIINNIPLANTGNLEKALRNRVKNPLPLNLMLGIIIPTGDRKMLVVPENTNTTIEVGVFCAKYNITSKIDCENILEQVMYRLEVPFHRRILLVIPIDAPDGRKIKLIIREGEQHNLRQFVADFLEFYHMGQSQGEVLTNEVLKRLPSAVLQFPVGLQNKRSVNIWFGNNDNITNTIEGFVNFFEAADLRIPLMKMARSGMAPGSYTV
jgi:hypothetical protein